MASMPGVSEITVPTAGIYQIAYSKLNVSGPTQNVALVINGVQKTQIAASNESFSESLMVELPANSKISLKDLNYPNGSHGGSYYSLTVARLS